MSIPLKARRFTAEEYLTLERAAEYKSEFYRGEIFAMAGGTARHSLITNNVGGTLRALLKGRRCTAYSSDLRIAIPQEELYTYPDVSVFCEPIQFLRGSDDTALNPTLIVEVLSPGTEAYVRGQKFQHYSTIASLREYLLVSQDEPSIERFARGEDGRWTIASARGLAAALRLESIDVELPVAEVFDKVDFSTPES